MFMAFHSKHRLILTLIFVFALVFGVIVLLDTHPDEQVVEDSHADLIRIDTPQPNTVITSPLTITGEARGYWFFEASFPVILVDWDGRIIAEHYASAQDEWMTEDFVPFTSTLEFESPYKEGDPDFMKRGALILKKDNPSGLPENDDAIEIPVLFESM